MSSKVIDIIICKGCAGRYSIEEDRGEGFIHMQAADFTKAGKTGC